MLLEKFTLVISIVALEFVILRTVPLVFDRAFLISKSFNIKLVSFAILKILEPEASKTDEFSELTPEIVKSPAATVS